MPESLILSCKTLKKSQISSKFLNRRRMLSLSRSLVRRNPVGWKLLPGKFDDVNDASLFGNFTSQFGFSTATSAHVNNGKYSAKTYANFSIYKGKAALSFSPILPKFMKTDYGSRVDRKGVVLLSFMPAIGQRKYDNEKKQMFALSATEVGSLISLGPSESCEFFHDPSMKSSMEGQVKKTLSVSPLQDGSGYFFNLSVLNSVQKTTERFNVPVTKAEFAVIRTACSFALPHIIGWDRVLTSESESTGVIPNRPGQERMRVDPDVEWGM